MRAVVQRVSEASVAVHGRVVGRCGKGLVVMVAAHARDTEREAVKMADRVWGLRIFNDAEGKLNFALRDLVVNAAAPPTLFPSLAGSPPRRGEGSDPAPLSKVEGYSVLAISNFTVYGETAKNRRPSFIESAPYERGEELFDLFVKELKGLGCPVETGIFGTHMDVSMVNDGPVTLIMDVPPPPY